MRSFKKRLISCLASVLMISSLLVGCSSNNSTKTSDASNTSSAEWPKKPINVMVPASAGGGTDIMMRTISEYITKQTGQAVVITNTTGLTGYEQLRQAEPNGYNFGVAITGLLISKAQGDLPYGHEAFDSVARIGSDTSTGIIVHKDSPYNTIQELVDAIKADPNSVTGGISMTGYPYLFVLALQEALGTEIHYVDAGNTAERNTALLGKQVDFIVSSALATKAYLDSGDFKFLAVGGEERDIFLSDVPTFKESGIDFSFPGQSVYLIAPKGTNPEVIKQFDTLVENIFKDEEFKAKYKELFMNPDTVLGAEDALKDMDEASAKFAEYSK